MGLFQKAVETYDAMEHLAGVFEEGREVLAPVGHIIATARIEITVDADGNFIRAKNIEEKIPIPCTEKSSGRAGLLPPAHPLCDKAKYVTENDDQKHHLYLEELKSWAESGYSSPKLQAVYQYVKSGHVLADLLDAGVVSCDSSGILKQKDDIITWRVEGLQEDSGAVYKDKQLMRQFMQYYLKVIPHKTNVCMISGNKEQIAQQHLKGISNYSGNAKLISSNDDRNYTFRGRFTGDEEALSIGYVSSQKAHNVLKWMLSNEKVPAGDRQFLCWNPHGKAVPRIHLPLLGVREDKQKPEPDSYKKQLREIILGYEQDLTNSESVVVASFEAATSGRLSMTYYSELQGADFLERLYRWDLTCCWDSWKWGAFSPSLYQVLRCAFGTQRGNEETARLEPDAKLIGPQMQRLIICRLDGTMFPMDILRKLVQKASNLQIYTQNNREELLTVTCAVIRKYQYDHNKEEWPMVLEENKKDRSYQYGRLLAIMEKIERDTYDSGESRETNAIRSQAFFVQRPQTAFSQIMTQLKTGYYPRLSATSRVFYDKLIGEVVGNLSEYSMQELNKPLSETYLMGYYLQKNALYTKKDQNTEFTNAQEEKEYGSY